MKSEKDLSEFSYLFKKLPTEVPLVAEPDKHLCYDKHYLG